MILYPPEEPNLSLPNIEKAKKIIELEHIIADLRVQLEESNTDREHAYETIKKLKDELFISRAQKVKKLSRKKHVQISLKRRHMK